MKRTKATNIRLSLEDQDQKWLLESRPVKRICLLSFNIYWGANYAFNNELAFQGLIRHCRSLELILGSLGWEVALNPGYPRTEVGIPNVTS